MNVSRVGGIRRGMTRSIVILAALLLAGCRQLEGGPEVSEGRTLEPFTRVRIEDGIPARLSPGAPQVTLNAPEKVVENLETIVLSGTLIVRLKHNVIVTDSQGAQSTQSLPLVIQGALSITTTGLPDAAYGCKPTGIIIPSSMTMKPCGLPLAASKWKVTGRLSFSQAS